MNEAHQQHHHVDGSIELSPPPCNDVNDGETCSLIDGHCNERNDEAHLATFDGSCAGAGERISQPVHCRRLYLAISSAVLAAAGLYLVTNNDGSNDSILGHKNARIPSSSYIHYHKKKTVPKTYPAFPAKALLGVSKDDIQTNAAIDAPYDPFNDFQYGKNNIRTLLYWEELVEAIEQYTSHVNNTSSKHPNQVSNTSDTTTVWSNLSTWGACYPRALTNRRLGSTSNSPINRNWTSIIIQNSQESIQYPTYKKDYFHNEDIHPGGHCRPSFLIIGQGKCGTSSFYHYLTGHPRVLPAKEKQIHYFLYHSHQSLKWYYSHFPSIESYLGKGALMSGEASPGYLPYPSVLEMVVKRLSSSTANVQDSSTKNGLNEYRDQIRQLPKILSIVREPIDRAISSYKYNYITPALERMRAGIGLSADGSPIPGGRSNDYYMRRHMFRLEDLIIAELKVLRRCLKEGGLGERYTRDRYGKFEDMFFYESIQRRRNSLFPNLVHLDGACYQELSSLAVPRVQWKQLGRRHPEKILALPDLQLVQSIIGRGLYAFPLEWWYEVFGSDMQEDREARIEVVCMEDMANASVETMENVTRFLGLPEFDGWENVTGVGRYNVGSIGGHRGYDSVSKVHEDEGEEDLSTSMDKAMEHLTSLSDSLMSELMEFYQPYNERLFELIGKRCSWDY
ncbi:hypothetical protein ACHAWO_005299 [Cyclotella atomus]|uniref:Sulfotransferase domain-containing protein n=1 Tax=Cyclotella atomus TaxID=382360 RepID=A0ABD3QBF5_9STRA